MDSIEKDIYNTKYVEHLFNKMSASYENVNYLTSFGFSKKWRNQCVKSLHIHKEAKVVDLMTGIGECWNPILKNINENGKLISLDISSEMVKRATQKRKKHKKYHIELLHENVFKNSIPKYSIDFVISGFGVKTFNEKQIANLAKEIYLMLKEKGGFSMIEVSVPENRFLRFIYMRYVKYVIPIFGLIFLGNPETYKMLGIYTSKFQNFKRAQEIFELQGFDVKYKSHFFGCASSIYGFKK